MATVKKLEKNNNLCETSDVVEVNTNIDTSKVPERDVKIRVRKNHRCTIGRTTYVFEKGKTYIVPLNVKYILDAADLLLPLL